MEPKSWLLLFLYATGSSANGTRVWPMDPVRLQKGLFLLTQNGPAAARGAYTFDPYNYGPCSFDLYRDLANLEAEGLVLGTVEPGHTWKTYEITPKGTQTATVLAKSLPTADLEQVRDIQHFVATRSFRRLLTDVYRQYPEFAENSVASNLRPR